MAGGKGEDSSREVSRTVSPKSVSLHVDISLQFRISGSTAGFKRGNGRIGFLFIKISLAVV